MKFVAKCSAYVSLSYQVHVKVCNPIPLTTLFLGKPPGKSLPVHVLSVSAPSFASN